MSYEVGFKPAALRQLRKLDVNVQVQILAGIESLAEYPRPEGYKKLKRVDYRFLIPNFNPVLF